MNATIELPQPLRDVQLMPSMAHDATTAGQVQADDLEKAAYERGRLEGERAMGDQLMKQRADFRDLQNGVLQSLRQSVHQVVHDSEDALVALAIEVSRKLVAGIPISPEMVEAAVREALTQIEETSEFTIHLHPQDLALLEQMNSQLLAQNAAGQRMHFHASSDVTRGGCLVRTQFGTIDGRRETKLDLIRKNIQP